jgi:3-oxo-5-alpha-steroid 4-dehydrogenase 1
MPGIMDDLQLLRLAALAWTGVGVLTLLGLFFVTAPYGRHSRSGWGPVVSARLGWVIMEAASPVALSYFFLRGNWSPNLVTVVFLGLFLSHYLNRTFIYPLRMRNGQRPMALSIVAMGLLFNLVNGCLNGLFLNLLAGRYAPEWLLSPRFLIGLALFLGGMVVNLHSDGILRNLRVDDEPGYRIPRGGLFELVSCANYFGELVEWVGWACLTWTLGGVAFAVWTAANLVPRALAHHRWYRSAFPEYPEKRRAIIPFLL